MSKDYSAQSFTIVKVHLHNYNCKMIDRHNWIAWVIKLQFYLNDYPSLCEWKLCYIVTGSYFHLKFTTIKPHYFTVFSHWYWFTHYLCALPEPETLCWHLWMCWAEFINILIIDLYFWFPVAVGVLRGLKHDSHTVSVMLHSFYCRAPQSSLGTVKN